jgi:hypothetical protein
MRACPVTVLGVVGVALLRQQLSRISRATPMLMALSATL